MNRVDGLLQKHKVIVCAGSGGVGKTTLSASLGVRAAELGLRVLVLTIDPAKRLATALGLETLSNKEIRVPGQTFKGELWASVVDSKTVFDEFVVQHVKDQAEREKILKNRLYDQLSTTLSGSQEYTALEKLYQVSKSGKYDLVILDTPPAQHAVDFLKAPEKMYALFQNAIVKWFLPQDTAVSGLRGLIDRGTKAVFQALETLTGAAFLEELREFFHVIRSLQSTIQEHSGEIHTLLTGTSSTFVVVTSFDETKIQEAKQFRKLLLSTGYNLSTVIINRAFPEWLNVEEAKIEVQNELLSKLRTDYLDLKDYFSRHQDSFARFASEMSRELDVLRIPDFDQEIHDLQSLEKVANELVIRGQ